MKDEYKDTFDHILEKHSVIFAYIFGSHAQGTTGALSDLDIAVFFSEQLSPGERFEHKLRIAAEIALLKKIENIDIVSLNDTYPLLAHRILSSGYVIFSREEKKRLAYELQAVMEYLDFKPFIERHTREIIYG